MTRVLALIAARAGSKGLRHKNVLPFDGVPLLGRAIGLAQACPRRGEAWRVAVSTENRAYAALARRAGAEIIARPAKLATARARLIDVVLHAIADAPVDLVVLLSATTPLTTPADVHRAINAWRRHRVGIATVCGDTPASLRFTSNARGVLFCTGHSPPGRRQEEPECWRLNGAVYVATPEWLRRHGRFVVAGKSVGVPMPKGRSIDIDDAEDLAIATALLACGRTPTRRE